MNPGASQVRAAACESFDSTLGEEVGGEAPRGPQLGEIPVSLGGPGSSGSG